MATTFIYPIKSTPQASLDYGIQNKSHSIVQTEIQTETGKDDTKDSLNYICQNKKGMVYELPEDYLEKMKRYIKRDGDKITFETLSTGVNCSVRGAHKEFKKCRDAMNKINGNKGNLQYCIVQAFGSDLDPMTANEIGVKFAKEYLLDYQTVVSTHIDTGLVHNHIEFNATSFVTGKKFNDTLAEISKRREVSDRICEEYGLDVLEETRNAKFITWTDDNGKTRFYEPTRRKNEKIIERDEGRISKADVGSFVNTDTFEITETVKETNVSVIQRDIDMLLPEAESFDHLMYLMRELGYKIRDKKKDEDYMAHISYKAPEHGKATREDKLGKEYTREALTEKIEKQIMERNEKKEYERTAKDEPIADTRGQRIMTDDVPDEEINEAVTAIKEKYLSQTVVIISNKYISFAVADMTVKHNEFAVLKNRPADGRDKERQRVAYLKNCIREDISLINYIEENGAKAAINDERYSKTLERLGIDNDQSSGADKNKQNKGWHER